MIATYITFNDKGDMNMFRIFLWILAMLIMTSVNFIAWGVSDKYILFDISLSLFLGIICGMANNLIVKGCTRNTKILVISVMCGLSTVPFVLHYRLVIKLLSIVMTQKYSPIQIFTESLYSSIKIATFTTLMIFIVVYLTVKIKSLFGLKTPDSKLMK